jgi:radical SAM protein with 4Fe4S-binding SPASM domain
VAGDRILAVTPDGTAFPCSQLVHPRFCAGNLLSDRLDELWAESPILRRYRLFRNKNAFGATTCGLCAAKTHCGGCRAFADDAWGAEPECPGPLVPAVNQLGKAGRRWDIDRYLRSHGSISVGEYMQRYAVGQKRAISELRAFGYPLQSGTGRRQSDVYGNATEDLVGEVQQMIGFTSGGVPFAARDEVARWSGADSVAADGHYPHWLRARHDEDDRA